MQGKESKFKIAKKETAKEIAKFIKESKSLIIAEYRGLTVSEITKLRVLAKKQGINIKVYKNRIFKFGAQEAGFKDLDKYLTGPNIFAFSNLDELAAAKVLVSFSKDNKLLVPKAGIFEGKIIDAQNVLEVSSLPNYQEALTILARSLMAPLQKLSLGLKLYSEKNETKE